MWSRTASIVDISVPCSETDTIYLYTRKHMVRPHPHMWCVRHDAESHLAPGPSHFSSSSACGAVVRSVKKSTAHCSVAHVAAVALQALKVLHACPSTFKVENLVPSSW